MFTGKGPYLAWLAALHAGSGSSSGSQPFFLDLILVKPTALRVESTRSSLDQNLCYARLDLHPLLWGALLNQARYLEFHSLNWKRIANASLWLTCERLFMIDWAPRCHHSRFSLYIASFMDLVYLHSLGWLYIYTALSEKDLSDLLLEYCLSDDPQLIILPSDAPLKLVIGALAVIAWILDSHWLCMRSIICQISHVSYVWD